MSFHLVIARRQMPKSGVLIVLTARRGTMEHEVRQTFSQPTDGAHPWLPVVNRRSDGLRIEKR